ncbi:uri1, prefoldin-like chaperone [Coemansia sp. RSA 2399]|nr:uri1, prefoldin-like chaperone [Coemansia sp. RSA 2399]
MADAKGKRVQEVPAGKETSETYSKYVQQSRESLQSTLAKFKEYKADYRSLQKTLVDLPDEIEYQAMIPVGPLAFFPGKIVHTNEILVLLGDNWFVDRSAKQAAEIAKRREDYVDGRIELVENELQGMDKREVILDEKPKDDIKSLIQANIPERMYNDDGEDIVDIKEELGEGQLPLFSDDASARSDNTMPRRDDDGVTQSVSEALDAKRKRAIEQLARKHVTDENDHDYSKLSAEQRQILEFLDQIGSDDDDDEDDSSDSDSTSASDEGDAFSDDDRANAVRDDDDDDYNDNVVPGNDANGGDIKMRVVERRSPASANLPQSPMSPPKGILKPSSRISLFKSRRQVESSDEDSEWKQQKSVSFNTVAEAYTQSNTELLDESNIDEDVSKVANLMTMLTTRSSTSPRSPETSIGNPPRITVIDEVSAEEEEEEEVRSPALKEVKANDTGPSSATPFRFKPNTAALAGVRSKTAVSSVSGKKPSTSTTDIRNSGKSTAPKTVAQQNPMKTRVVERSPTTDESDNMLDVVDEELHAREIAQTYNRMRFARMSAGKLDGAADVAERVLSQVPGVALVDQKGDDSGGDSHQDTDSNGDGYERIELPSDPSPFNSKNNRPPEVIRQARPKVVAPTLAASSNELTQDSGSRSISKEKQQAKPKMSRFKAQRLGLDQ